jgi:hypothetical protein
VTDFAARFHFNVLARGAARGFRIISGIDEQHHADTCAPERPWVSDVIVNISP